MPLITRRSSTRALPRVSLGRYGGVNRWGFFTAKGIDARSGALTPAGGEVAARFLPIRDPLPVGIRARRACSTDVAIGSTSVGHGADSGLMGIPACHGVAFKVLRDALNPIWAVRK